LSAFAVKGFSIERNGLLLINELSFSVEDPFFLAITGDNGSGKTTFLKAILDKHPYRGVITKPSGNIGYIAQKNQLQFDMKVKDLLVMGCYTNKGVFDNYSTEDYHLVKVVLQKIGLAHKYEQSYQDLSGGEQQLIWLAQQLILSPKLLLLDEPTANLDIKNKTLFFSHLKTLIKQGTQIICVTHDLYFLKNMNGYCINVSAKKPTLQHLSPATIENLLCEMSK